MPPPAVSIAICIPLLSSSLVIPLSFRSFPARYLLVLGCLLFAEIGDEGLLLVARHRGVLNVLHRELTLPLRC
jgi:hypothetical protein